ncbi:hypothetical protein AN9190.2 [Aspergillus nidulans FGSC A4]|nr:hypothetical protein AN9190.2 [Aspergillus nidulans FGSC A4]|eukprot:XP_682459.1 hypothetical protein AN9190.2 [Aspergillus nidulans FGSC A4]
MLAASDILTSMTCLRAWPWSIPEIPGADAQVMFTGKDRRTKEAYALNRGQCLPATRML